jgi:hypothetical protein
MCDCSWRPQGRHWPRPGHGVGGHAWLRASARDEQHPLPGDSPCWRDGDKTSTWRAVRSGCWYIGAPGALGHAPAGGRSGHELSSPPPAFVPVSRQSGVALVGDDHDAVGVRERALSLLVGIAGEAAGALATLEHSAAVGADRGVGRDRSGNPPTGSRRMSRGALPASRRTSRSATPVARSASTARRAATSVGYVLVSVVMEVSFVVSRVGSVISMR